MQRPGPGSSKGNPAEGLLRTAEFWARTTGIYLSYKGTQARAGLLRSFAGKTEDQLKEEVWIPQHEASGQAMYDLCVSLRGFYLKAGQFIGSRSDFVPEQICRHLALLCDRVPPMPPHAVSSAICKELRVNDLSEVFSWINLEKPLGSASISQVHKAKLRGDEEGKDGQQHGGPFRFLRRGKGLRQQQQQQQQQVERVVVEEGQGAWDVCNLRGVTLTELADLNKGVDLDTIQPGQQLVVPQCASISAGQGYEDRSSSGSRASSSSSSSSGSSSSSLSGSSGSSSGGSSASSGRGLSAAQAARRALATGVAPLDGIVAVKIQYPDALRTMTGDLKNLRAAAAFLSKTEIKFDLVSAVDELNKQIRLEFDFTREARVMDSIALHLRPIQDRVVVPRSVPGLVTPRLLVMEFMEGIPLTDLGSHTQGLSEAKKRAAKKRILSRLSEAYGMMMLKEGLFQADGHPGNILVGRGGRLSLLDYGQSKQLPRDQREALASLVLEMVKGDPERISGALADIGVETEKQDPELRTEMAYGMFDTRGKVDPFDPNSPIKQSAINRFPADMFFVLRVVQLLRGLADGMGINDFSSADQWAPLAKEACRGHQQQQQQQQQQSRPKKLASRFASMGSPEMGAATEGGRGWGVTGSLRNLITWPYRPHY
ncbi:ABC1/COQ8 ser/thr kinase [Dunaliella salina]|uniref:ABC1/COQ8 ser/thr kinase n=1 Tax=Dunaliella salina TaxID=3046 RepID=A0ABQ7H330_DUNSA|nr:ABC1/COQ8 ser/thr kinase [Dunaliella salina]|eukprot:KAF5841271.1 ABC1/COQ8 ser/thr kinase [Dunaliella salina]